MEAVRADEVVLDREQERLVLGELHEPALGRGVEVSVQRDLDDEVRRAARLRERGHAQEDPAGLLVLGDRLERFEVFEPQLVHEYPTAPAAPRIRLGFQAGDLSYIRDEVARRMQEMLIYGVSFDLVGKQPIVLLKTADGNKFLPIWIGHPEAAAILMKLQSQTSVRPMTHDLFSDMLEQLGASISRITVTELRENTFYAQITVVQDGQEVEVDSRPSDAIALAIRAEAPIFAADDVIAES